MNKWAKLGAVAVITTLLGVATFENSKIFSGISNVSAASKESKAVKKAKAKAKRQFVNEKINNELKIYQGMADGTMDADGNPVDGGNPDPKYGWAPYIFSIKYTADGDLNMVVVPEFNDLSKSNKAQLARNAQNFAFTVLGDNYKKWADSYDRPYMYIYDSTAKNAFPIGRSKAFETNKFTFK
ncbi:hypothetical protein HAU46_08435 [Weissella confusa]|uniref:hypothetical protein n=1 Tax=Weissella confusa TaxID=1583 RepID=UPI0018F2054D|nr:hypothetical protein [Weissella confusa]MBJ7647997.1 hypothetical protein [Weissella confusa]